MNYIVFNKDGSVKNIDFASIIVKGSNNVDEIAVAIDGYDNDSFTANANFLLPDGDSNQLDITTPYSLNLDGSIYQGYKFALTSAQTAIEGNVIMSIELTNANQKKYTYQVILTINPSVVDPDSVITNAEYQNLVQNLSNYQKKYTIHNARFYTSLAQAQADLGNLAPNQCVIIADISNPSVAPEFYYKSTQGELVHLNDFVPTSRTIAGIDLNDDITQDELNSALQIKVPYLNAQDLDDVEAIGNYVAVACSNTPVSGHSYLLQVQLYRSTTNPLDNPWIIQIAYDLNSSNFDCYFRRQNSNVWGNWQKIYTDSNFSHTIPDGSITTEKLNNDCLIKYPYLNNQDLNDIKDLGRYVAVSCTNTPYNQTFLLDVQRYKTATKNVATIIQIACDYALYGNKDIYFRIFDSSWTTWKKLIDNVSLESILENYLTNTDLFDYTSNLANPDKIIEGKFIDWQSGGIATSEIYRLEDDYIDVENGDTYIALLNENDGIFYDDSYAILGAFYDSSRSYVDEIYITNSETRGATFVNGFYKLAVPNGAKYFKFSVKDNANHYKWFVTKNIENFVKYGQVKNEYLEKGGNLQGKTIVNFGDSIFGNTRDNTSVSSYLSQKTGAIVYNCGFGGCQMSKHSGNWDLCSMYQLANDIKNEDFSGLVSATTTGWSGMPGYFVRTAELLSQKIDFSKVDYITISYGTNDYREGDSVVGNQINIFDGNFDEEGYIDPSNGQNASASGFKRTSKYYPIKQVSNLYLIQTELNPNFVLLFYDIEGNYLGYSSHSSSRLKYTFNVPANSVCFRAYTNDGNTTENCISYQDSDVVVPYFNNEDVIDCLRYSIKTIKEKYPKIKILVTTPIYRSFLDNSNKVMTNSDVADFGGGTLEDYSQAYIKACEELKVPCLDLYHLSQLNKQSRGYFYPEDDGTHPNEKGRELLADLIGSKLEEM